MITAIINQKGGTGKTTTTVNLGSALAKMEKNVLLVDLDPQGNLSYSFGLDQPGRTISEVINGEVSIADSLAQVDGLHVLPADISLADTEFSLIDRGGREQVLATLLAQQDFDHILIDCPPSLSLLTVNALSACSKVIIPMQLEVLSLQGLDLIVETVSQIKDSLNPHLQILGVLPVLVDKRRKLTAEVQDYVSNNYDIPLFESRIRNNVKASEAPSFGKSVIDYAPQSNSAKDYVRFAKEFLEITKK